MFHSRRAYLSRSFLALSAAVACFVTLASDTANNPAIYAQAPARLHEKIDALIAARAGGPVAPPASDAEFLRRVSLDFAGVIPAPADVRTFLADTAPDKRVRLIDRLLDGPDYPRRMEQAFTVMLLERREGPAVPDMKWRDFLRSSFAANRPWNQLVRDLLAADGSTPESQGAVKLFVDAARGDGGQMAQDVGRLLLGMNLHCARCHDHPTVADFKQADYFGLLAFLQGTKPHTNPQSKAAMLADTPLAAKLDFQSVFSPDEKHATGPRIPGGDEVVIPVLAKGEELAQPAKDGLPAIPKFRPRLLLADQLVAPANRRFVHNSVNRFWFLMMGRGLVHPLDMLHSGNPPSHPELLVALSDEFVASQFNVKHLLREIALSAAYQRSSELPAGVTNEQAGPATYRVANAKPLSAEQLVWSMLRATGHLDQVVAAPAPEKSKFTFQDYLNGRIARAPDNLPDTLKLFEAVFGNPPGEPELEFQPSMGAALFVMNERLVLQWLEPGDSAAPTAPDSPTLVARLTRLAAPDQVADELYLAVLGRLPAADERSEVAAHLDRHKDARPKALAQLAWALLASAEFRLNH